MDNDKGYNRCPACSRRIDAMRALFGSETAAFRCRGCNKRLVKKTATIAFSAAAIVSWYALKDRFGWAGWQTWASLAVFLAIVTTITLMMTRVRLATEHDPDPEPELHGPVREGPPPLDPSFRGMSGPPEDKASGDKSRND